MSSYNSHFLFNAWPRADRKRAELNWIERINEWMNKSTRSGWKLKAINYRTIWAEGERGCLWKQQLTIEPGEWLSDGSLQGNTGMKGSGIRWRNEMKISTWAAYISDEGMNASIWGNVLWIVVRNLLEIFVKIRWALDSQGPQQRFEIHFRNAILKSLNSPTESSQRNLQKPGYGIGLRDSRGTWAEEGGEWRPARCPAQPWRTARLQRRVAARRVSGRPVLC